jgi:hypothetical protein
MKERENLEFGIPWAMGSIWWNEEGIVLKIWKKW